MTAKQKDKTEANQQQMQELYMQLQYITAQVSELQKEAEAIEQKRKEFSILAEKLGELDKIKKDTKSFSDIGAGIFAQTKIADTKDMLVSVGANTFVKKPAEKVRMILRKQTSEFDKVLEQISQNMTVLSIQGQIIQAQMQKGLDV